MIGIKVLLIISVCFYHAGALDTLFMPGGWGGWGAGSRHRAAVWLWVALRRAQVELKWRSETPGRSCRRAERRAVFSLFTGDRNTLVYEGFFLKRVLVFTGAARSLSQELVNDVMRTVGSWLGVLFVDVPSCVVCV